MFQDLLVPLSGETESWQVLEQALVVARHEGARLNGLHIVADVDQVESESALAVREQFEALRDGGAARLGFLLGTRRYAAARPFFQFGERLEISVRLVFRDQGMGVFDCKITGAGGETLAEAQLSVYQPEQTGESPS